MRHIFIIAFIISAFSFAGCKKCCTISNNSGQDVGEFCYSSKAQLDNWEKEHASDGYALMNCK